ncbi:hypothetical protein V2I01_39370 [Micromonospora sp. BRA006-A]|nr:hypothetical protein [Micromonospora sp. BRA006-A]
MLLDATVPAGSRIRLQKDPANTTTYAIDFVDTELVSPRANPDPARYKVPTGFSHADVQNALDAVRMDTTGTLVGVYLPAGTYETAQKFQVYGKAVKVVGAGMAVHPVPDAAQPAEHRRGFPGRVSERVHLRPPGVLRQLHRPDRRSRQGVG